MATKQRIPLLLATVALGLTSCGKVNYYGTYAFQLGATKGTHMGLYMELSDEKVTKTDSEGNVTTLGEKFVLTMDMDGIASSDEAALLPSDSSFRMSGYWTVGCETDPNRLNLGTTLFDEFFESGSNLVVPSALVELILFASISDKSVTVHIPVSMDDLAFQLYWYGYRVDLVNWSFDILADQHEIGTHPTAEEAKAIAEAETAKGLTDNMYAEYRDYHTLSMGLLKQ